MEPQRSLEELAKHMERIREMEAYVTPLVRQARLAGASWESVGRSLGVSKQHAHKVYAPLCSDLPFNYGDTPQL